MKVSESEGISEAEMAQMERKYQNSTQLISAILEGPAVGFIRNKKKRAKRSGSRGKYISHCIVFYETHKLKMMAMEEEIESLWKTIDRLQNQ